MNKGRDEGKAERANEGRVGNHCLPVPPEVKAKNTQEGCCVFTRRKRRLR